MTRSTRSAPTAVLLILALLGGITNGIADEPQRVLRYDKPAANWQSEALPIGNGRLGCMIFGGVPRERIQFNEDSLWIGDELDTGAYQAFGDVLIDFDHQETKDYQRRLDIRDSVYEQEYVSDGVRYRRRYFASHPAQVLVFEFTADKPGALGGRVTLTDSHGAEIRVEDKKLVARGDLRGLVYGEEKRRDPEAQQYRVALQYEAQALVQHEGGEVTTGEDGQLVFKDCDGLTILLAAGTNFDNDRSLGWTSEHPHDRIESQLAAASKRSVDELFAEHRDDYRRLFDRVSIDLGDGPIDLTTDRRVKEYSADQPDLDLEELLYQYARYLMISSSRPGDQPANLQGIWNESNNPIWRCDYHSDVNTEMNYWFVDQANLSECFEPLAEWVYSIREPRRDTTFVTLGKPGWALRGENGLFGGSTWMWSKGDASWLAQNLWDHYAFTGDKDYLRKRVYPVQRDLCEFWLADMKELPNGKLVSPLGFSPEHGPHEDGVSFDQQLIWDLFTNTIETTEALGVDPEFREELRAKRDRLLGPQIGKWGQLQEWMVDRDDPKENHRHVSHMIAVHPGRQISPLATPEFAEAAAVSLAARPEGGAGWSKAWKASIWARLHKADKAYHELNLLITEGAQHGESAETSNDLDAHQGGIQANLLNTHPPFQIDGNFGYASAVGEMLLQSHLGYLHFLPAAPEAWAKGSIRGLKARGGFQVDFEWSDGALAEGVIRSDLGQPCRIYSKEPLTVLSDSQEVVTYREGDVVRFATEPGATYEIRRESP